LVRYCQYEAKEELNDTDGTASTINPTQKLGASPSSIVLHFRGQDIAIDTYKQIAVLYLKMEPFLKSPGALDESQFLQLLSDLDDATQLVATEMKQYESVGSTTGPAVAAKLSSLRAVHAYFRYQKLSIWRYQQEKRVATLTNDVEIVHVYDALQQNAIAMAELPMADDHNSDDDPDCLEAQAHVVRIRALRCYHLARLYESTLNGTSKQILALLKHSEKLARRATDEIAASDTIEESEAESYLDALSEMCVKIKAMKCRVEATKYLESTAEGFATSTQRPLWLRLDDLDAGQVLADDPPLPIPMPCKGVFYDLAWQQVVPPVTALEEYISAHETKKSRGFLGWFGSS
jgi:RNA-binding signal recognition particle 68